MTEERLIRVTDAERQLLLKLLQNAAIAQEGYEHKLVLSITRKFEGTDKIIMVQNSYIPARDDEIPTDDDNVRF